MVEFSTILSFIQAGGIVVGVAYYILNIENNRRNQELTLKSQELTRQAQEQATETRHTQLYMQVFNMTMNNRTFMDSYFKLNAYPWKDYDDFVESIGFNGPEITELGYELLHVTSVLEGIGVMVKENMLEIHLIAVFMSAVTRMLWEKIESYVWKYREAVDLPRWISEYEYLYNELMKYNKEHPELAT